MKIGTAYHPMYDLHTVVTETQDGPVIEYSMSADISMSVKPISDDSGRPVYLYKPPRFAKLRNWWRYTFWYEVKTRVRVLFYGLPEQDDYED